MLDPAQRGGYTSGMEDSMPQACRPNGWHANCVDRRIVIRSLADRADLHAFAAPSSVLCMALAAWSAAGRRGPCPVARRRCPPRWNGRSDARPEQRAELQRELERHAQVLEAQSTVVKIVAKLVGPAVVHIEADVPPDASPHYGRGRHVEEAGSGVIIELKGKYYVLTNRHVVRDAAPEAIKINLADGRRIHPDQGLGGRRDRRGRAGRLGARPGRRARWATATGWRSAISCWPWAAPSG